jgi:hypothetical protein
MLTPDLIIQELQDIRRQSEKGVELLAHAEQKYIELDLEAERIEAQTLLAAEGTVVDRQARAKLESSQARLEASVARVEVQRIKTKLRHLSESMMAVMSAGKMVEITYKSAGIGER